jgi:hypothetical protein
MPGAKKAGRSSMGTLRQLLLYYGDGEEIFKAALEKVDIDLRRGAISALCRIMQQAGSDKGLGRHNYTYLYDALFKDYPSEPRHVFELGVGSINHQLPANMGPGGVPGASLRGWREYFGDAQVWGADIDREILIQEDRISTLYVDQRDLASVMSLWNHIPISPDLIIDDGLHEFEANQVFLFGSKHKLSSGGLYIIEDIYMSTSNVEKFDAMLNHAGMSGFLYRLPHANNAYDNAVAVLCGPRWGMPSTTPPTR